MGAHVEVEGIDLPILRYDPAKKIHILQLSEGPYAGHPFPVKVSVCGTALCKCTEMAFCLAYDAEQRKSMGMDAVEDALIPFFILDLNKKEIVRERIGSIEGLGRNVSEDMVSVMDEGDWNALFAAFFRRKQLVYANMDLDTLAATLPDDPLKDPGINVGYFEIFPYALSLDFAIEGGPWLADDQYCVNPSCVCHDAGLTLVDVAAMRGRGKRALKRFTNHPAIRYDYRSRTYEVLMQSKSGQPRIAELMDGLTQAHPDLAQKLRERQGHLRRLYARVFKKVQRQSVEREPAIPAKVGRNDPCPCGSGKKFKRCCGLET